MSTQDPAKPLSAGTDLGHTNPAAVAEEPTVTFPATAHGEIVSILRTVRGRFSTLELNIAATLKDVDADIKRLSALIGVD